MKQNIVSITEATAFLPDRIKYPILAIKPEVSEDIKEIRIKKGCPVCLVFSSSKGFLLLDGSITDNPENKGICIAKEDDFDEAVGRLFNYSLHAYQNQMKNGFITILGGHRVGIAASCVMSNQGEISAIKGVSSLNIRIAREIEGIADDFLKYIFTDKIKSVLIVGEPSSGKTTLLREIARKISGAEYGFQRVCIVDERGEIASVSINKLSNGCDILDGYPKAQGMMIALRSLSPDVIICDEIGSLEDVIAIENIANSGVKIIASIHALNMSELSKRPQFRNLMKTGAFDLAVFLFGKNNPGKIRDVVSLKKYWR